MRAAALFFVLFASWSASAAAQDQSTLLGERVTGSDKALHFGGSAVLAVVTYGLAAGVLDEGWQRAAAAAGAVAVVGLAKEGADLLGLGHPSLVDLSYDAFGILTGVGVALALDAVAFRTAGAAREAPE